MTCARRGIMLFHIKFLIKRKMQHKFYVFMSYKNISNGINGEEIKFFILLSWGGVRLSPLGTSATNWPIVPAQDDRWWVWSSRWNENWQRKQKYSEKTCPSATLPTRNHTWPDPGSNSGHRGGKPATNRLSYGKTARKSNYSYSSDGWLVIGCTECNAKLCLTPINVKLSFFGAHPV
jgi:hypothetical protein